ncbi:TIGR02453 family protein [Clostridia bacterium]|nr:TIGR02453 family protein [Clostridia bacterium]
MINALKYLTALEHNNNREWYHDNKEQLQNANAEFEQLIQELIISIGKFDETILHNIPKELTFKLVHDTRFSHDKSPYNPMFRAHISSAGKLPIPVGYFISVAPENRSFIGGGLFASMFKDATTMIRDYIVEHGDELDTIVKNQDFSVRFAIKGETLKNIPRGYDETHPQAEYLKFKSWYLEYPITDNIILSNDFVGKATSLFHAMKPFNDYLNSALKDFRMPTR